ncbi:WD40-repeat-containing domain protein [Powellomyces hirtus]|nr:WD40-repeat-containing domain protein [Powellomyces hirtus]
MGTRTHTRIDTEYSADAVEFCPVAGRTNVVAVGTYQVKDEAAEQPAVDVNPTSRLGRLLLYTLGARDGVGNVPVREECRIDGGAILDLKWSHQLVGTAPQLGVVDAQGNLKVFSLSNDSTGLSLAAECSNGKEDVLSLSLDWSNRLTANSSDPQIVISESDGSIARMSMADGALRRIDEWHAHEFEAWIAAFNYWNTDIIYTGGDDCTLKVWDMRLDPHTASSTSRRHEAGVCSIQSHPHKEHIIATGSYDERVLIWDTRKMRAPVTEYHTGGGVWRLKWHPADPARLLAASMHNGFHILNVNIELAQVTDLASYMEHTSLAYGADWSYDLGSAYNGSIETLGTCSFYDHSFHVWDCKF